MSTASVPAEPAGDLGMRVGGLMRVAQQWIVDATAAQVRSAGYHDLGRAQIGLFRANIPDGLRPTEVAERLRITKQSVNDLIRDMEARGYLVLVPDPTDARARIIRLTAKGRQLHSAAHQAAIASEQVIAELLGRRRFEAFRRALEDIVTHINAGDLDLDP